MPFNFLPVTAHAARPAAKRIALLSVMTIGMLSAIPAQAAIEIEEADFGPSYETMVVDTVVGKPLQLVAAIAGTATYVISLPFSHYADNVEQAQQKLVTEPWQAMYRCLGCTVAEDNYYSSQAAGDGVYRIVVDQPSEILIRTDQNVVVLPQ